MVDPVDEMRVQLTIDRNNKGSDRLKFKLNQVQVQTQSPACGKTPDPELGLAWRSLYE